MDRNFHNDDFERLLREKSNEFRMYPSKRIWHSIYNNIHPGRKWPSIAMSITLITSLFLVGYLNTRNNDLLIEPKAKSIVQNVSFQLPNSPFYFVRSENQIVAPSSLTISDKSSSVPNNGLKSNGPGKKVVVEYTAPGAGLNSNAVLSKNDPLEKTNDVYSTGNSSLISEVPNLINALDNASAELPDGVKNISDIADDNELSGLTYASKAPVIFLFENISENFGDNPAKDGYKSAITIQAGNSTVEQNNLAANKNDIISADDKAWIENYALYNRPVTKKWANKLAIQMYATPSVAYRVLSIHPDFSNTITAPPFAISGSSEDINTVLNQKPSFGLEFGAGIQYSISKKIRLKTGLQLNLTRYNIDAFQNSHPVTTLLTMHDFNTNTSYQVSRATPYSNKSGLESIKLHNETFQVSLPIGAEFKLLGNSNLQWNIGATIQPTFVAGAKSYLISTDRLNYVKESSMLNRWNLNAGFETNITFKSGNLTYQIGPQFRTQLYSTNSKTYAVEERLVNYGLKFGVSKTLK